jgi:PAS domain S-box-containing protein
MLPQEAPKKSSPPEPGHRLVFGPDRDREHTPDELAGSIAHLQLLLASVAQAVWELDRDGMAVVDSPSWRACTGQSREEWLGEGWTDAIHPDDRSGVLAHWRDSVRKRTPVDAECRLRSALSGWRWTNVRAAPLCDADGSVRKWVGLNIDVEERRRAEADLRASRGREAFLLRFSDALRAFDDADEIQRQACRLLARHLRADRVHYAEIREDQGIAIFGPDYHRDHAPSLTGRYPLERFGNAPRLRNGKVVIIDDVANAPDLDDDARRACQSLDIGSCIIAPLLRDGRLVWTLNVHCTRPRTWTPAEIALVREAGERTWADVERTRARMELSQANQRKDVFLATLAHELRSPLAPIRNGLHIARLAGRSDETLQRAVAMMDRQVGHLVRLVDDLLDVARIGAGKIALEREAVDVVEVVARSIESSRALLDEHGHALDVNALASPVLVEGDSERLAQVFINLLSNAAKYTERGGRVSVRVEASDDEAVVHVSDTGIGIPPAELQQVFDLYSQIGIHQGRAGGGLGIGLALVRKLVELHGGTVAAHSEGAGCGSTLSVRLPRLGAAPIAGGPAPAVTQSGSSRRCKVVVADDNVDAAESLGALLQFEGHDVIVVHDGEAAVAAVRDHRADAAILDLGMPGVGGLDAARRIRALPDGRDVRLIALTGWGQDTDREQTRAAGFDHHLVKPADPADVAAKLRRPGTDD